MKNKSTFLTVMAIFAYFAYRLWQGLLNEGYSLPKLISLLLILSGMAMMLYSRFKSFVQEIRKNFKK